MPKKKREGGNQVRVRNISDISGNVNVAGGNISTHHTTNGLSAAEIKQLFDGLYAEIDAHVKTSPANKEDIKAEVKEIQSTVAETAKKNEKVYRDFCFIRTRRLDDWAAYDHQVRPQLEPLV